VLAIPAYRMDPTGSTQFTFWETPPGMAKALRTWYYPGDNFGQEFPYPKHLVAVETASTSTTNNTTTENSTTTTETTPPPVATPPATEQPVQPPVTEEQQSAEMTQPEQQPTTPTEQQPTPVPQPSNDDNSSANRSAELPTTASPYPAIGAFGLLSLLGFAGLRFKRAVKQ